MRNKRFSNVTFTKRVDHSQGLRPVRAEKEPAQCPVCGSVYLRRRWQSRDSRAALRLELPVRPLRCPACKKQETQIPGGIVRVAGRYFQANRNQILRLLENEALRASKDNPLARIMDRQEEKGQVIFFTTTEHLAQRLGHALEKAFHGELKLTFSHENKLTRVFWQRD